MEQTAEERQLEMGRWRRMREGTKLASFYGVVAVLTVAAVEFVFAFDDGGFYVLQWYRGAIAISVALIISTLVPGYFTRSGVGRKQWTLAGALALLTVIVGASILWSISRELSFYEASRTAMYAGTFALLLPAAARWGWLIVDTTIFAGLTLPALYGLSQKVFPTVTQYTGFGSLEGDPRASSTVGYHPTFGMMCAMGALLTVSRVGSFRAASPYMIPLRAVYSAMGTLFLIAMFFSFSRGAVLALAGGALVLMVLSNRRFETLGNALISGLPALWLISQAREMPGLVARPVSPETMAADGWSLLGPLSQSLLLALILQVVFSLIVWLVEVTVPRGVRRGAALAGGLAVAVVVAIGLGWGWSSFQSSDGIEELRRDVLAQSPSETTDSEELSQDRSILLTSPHAGNRILHWRVAWENWKEHPLTGTGGDTFRLIYDQEKPEGAGFVLHSHSIWMDLLSNTGIFAFLTFAAFCVGVLALAARNALSLRGSRRTRALIAGSAAAATAYLISSSVDWNWYIPASTLPFFALSAVAVGMMRRSSRKKHTETPMMDTDASGEG